MKNLIVLLLLFINNILFSQINSEKRDKELFNEACLLQELFNKEFYSSLKNEGLDSNECSKKNIVFVKKYILEQAKEKYIEIIDDFEGSPLYFRALNNLALIYLEIDEKEDAIKTFQIILRSSANDMEKGGIGSGLSSEPFSNYKNRAAKKLAQIYIEDSNYALALKYLDSTFYFPYRHFCGNEHAASQIHIATQYTRCYIGLKNYQKAYEAAIPFIFENSLADNSKLLDFALFTLSKKFTKIQLKEKFEKSVKSIFVEHKTMKDGNIYNSYYMHYLGQKIYLNGLVRFNRELNIKEIEEECFKSKFYSLISTF